MRYGSLAGGIARGLQIGSEMNQRAAQEKRVQEEYDRQKKDREERDKIARALADAKPDAPADKPVAADDGAVASPVAIPRADVTPLLSADAAAGSTAAASPKVYDQGSGAPVAGQTPALTRIPTQAAPAAPTGAPMQLNAPAAPALPRLGSETAVEGDIVESKASAGMEIPAVAAAPAGQRRALPPSNEWDKLLTQWQASEKKALELGRPDVAMEYAMKGMPIREKVRQQAFDNARAAYDATGDVRAFIEPFNKYVNNGVMIDSMTRNPDGSVTVASSTYDGKSGTRTIKADEFAQMVRMASDPAAGRAMEAKYLEQLNAHRLKMLEAGAAHRFQSVAPGNTLVDTATGASFRNQPDPEVKPVVVPQGDGNPSQVIWYDPKKGVIGQNGGGAGADGTRPKALADLMSKANNLTLRNMGASDLSGLDPKAQEIASARQVLNEQIAAGAYGTKAFESMGEGTIAALSAAIQSGQVKPRPAMLEGRQVMAVEWQGQKYILGPVQRPGSAPAAPAAGGGSRSADGRDPMFRVSPQLQAQRDALGREVGADANAGKSAATLQSEIADIRESLSVKTGKGVPVEGLGMLRRELAAKEEALRRLQAGAAPAIPRMPTGLGTRAVQGEVTR